MSRDRGSPLYAFPFVDGPAQDVRFLDLRKMLKILAWAAGQPCRTTCSRWQQVVLSMDAAGDCEPCQARAVKAALDERTRARRLKNRQEGSIAALVTKGLRRRVPSARG